MPPQCTSLHFYASNVDHIHNFNHILNQVGFGTFLLRYIPGLVRSVLTELGIDEDMYNPVCKSRISFPLICLDVRLNYGCVGWA